MLINNISHITAQSIATSFTPTSSVDMSSAIQGAVHLIWTGTPTGTVTVQCSNNNSDWDTVATQALAGSAGNKMVSLADCGYVYLRVIYTSSSGTGTLTAVVSAKDNK